MSVVRTFMNVRRKNAISCFPLTNRQNRCTEDGMYPFLDQQPLLVYYANSTDPVQTPQKAASELGKHNLLTGIPLQKTIK